MIEDLSNRSTVSNSIPEINSLYAYESRQFAPFTHNHQKGFGYKYVNHRSVLRSNVGEIHVYHQSVVVRKVQKCITMVTKNGNPDQVRDWFSKQLDAIEKDNRIFERFANAQTPTELGILYLY